MNIYSSGLERGIEQGIYSVAKNLLNVLDDTTIAETTGLTVEEIQLLRSES